MSKEFGLRLKRFRRCPACGKWFDSTVAAAVQFHGGGHGLRRRPAGAGARESRPCQNCAGIMYFFSHRGNEFCGYWLCGKCGRMDGAPQAPAAWK